MTKQSMLLALLCLTGGTLSAQHAVVTPLMSKDLLESPGKELSMITVEYAAGGSGPIHRHNAHGLIYVLEGSITMCWRDRSLCAGGIDHYVLEGSIIMQVKSGQQVTLIPGQTFYEGPDDVHVVGRNASSSHKAKFLVFFLRDKGTPILVPAK
jgi:quercetin dioxygenase-like cupin family protein